MLAAKNQTHTLLFTLDSPLPPELAATAGLLAPEPRREAQAKFANFIKKTGRTTSLLVARFIARQVAIETQKLSTASLMGLKKPQTPVLERDFTDAEGTSDGYTLSDHIERLRYLEIEKDEEEARLLIDVLRYAVPGLEGFITGERHTMIAGKMAYNAFGVCYAGGRDDKVRSLLHYLTTK
jgi:import receptor subunit TOM20